MILWTLNELVSILDNSFSDALTDCVSDAGFNTLLSPNAERRVIQRCLQIRLSEPFFTKVGGSFSIAHQGQLGHTVFTFRTSGASVACRYRITLSADGLWMFHHPVECSLGDLVEIRYPVSRGDHWCAGGALDVYEFHARLNELPVKWLRYEEYIESLGLTQEPISQIRKDSSACAVELIEIGIVSPDQKLLRTSLRATQTGSLIVSNHLTVLVVDRDEEISIPLLPSDQVCDAFARRLPLRIGELLTVIEDYLEP